MTESQFARAAHYALRVLDNESRLLLNPLVRRERLTSYQAARSAILGALQWLEPVGEVSASTAKERRHYDILVHCDLRGEPHKAVIAKMGLSRRQFYRDRREALLRFASAVSGSLKRTQSSLASVDLGEAAHALVEALRTAGQYEGVWREATGVAMRCQNKARETRFWIVASEAARYLAHPRDAREAFDRALGAVGTLSPRDRPYSLVLWVTIGDINLQWAEANYEGARAAFMRAEKSGPGDDKLHGDEAILFSVILGYVASIELDCGRWDSARRLLARASRLAENTGALARSRSAIAAQSLLRLRAQLLWRTDGELTRSVADHRSALDADRSLGYLGSIAMSAGFYSAVLGQNDPARALPYAQFALEIAQRFYPGDRLARLALEVLPLLLRSHGSPGARETFAKIRREGLGVRDQLFLDLAEAKLEAQSGSGKQAVERAENSVTQFIRHGMDAWASDAQLIVVEETAKLGEPRRARRQLRDFFDTIKWAGTAEVRNRARRLHTTLEL